MSTDSAQNVMGEPRLECRYSAVNERDVDLDSSGRRYRSGFLFLLLVLVRFLVPRWLHFNVGHGGQWIRSLVKQLKSERQRVA